MTGYVAAMTRDWVAWHREYADPDSGLSRRLEWIRGAMRAVFDEAPPGPITVLSLCSGEARDVSGAATGHSRAGDIVGAAVELSGGLASIAADNLRAAGTAMEVRCVDAGRSMYWDDLLPVDLLVLAGIFGNLSDDHIRRTIAAVPAMVRPGGTIIWTRHRHEPDATPMIRDAFAAVGCEEVSFVSDGPDTFSVGVARRAGTEQAALPGLLFRFLEDAW